MAEVRFDVTATDGFSAVLSNIYAKAGEVFPGLGEFAVGLESNYSRVLSVLSEILKGMETFNTAGDFLENLKKALESVADSNAETQAEMAASIEDAYLKALKSIEGSVDSIQASLDDIRGAIADPFVVIVSADSAIADVDRLSSLLEGLDLQKTLTLEVDDAIAGAGAVRAAIDAIPDVSYKEVIVQYKTQASPVRPFTEGIEYIRSMMESLPRESSHTVRYSSAEGASARTASGASTGAASFSPSINITMAGGGSTDGASLARQIDAELARLWKYNRSELRRIATA